MGHMIATLWDAGLAPPKFNSFKMADKKISQLTAAGPLTGAEVLPIVQNGNTVKVSAQDVANTAVSLSFNWSIPDRIYSARIDGTYKPLQIIFNNLVLEPGVTYTLLIDRWRFNELKNNKVAPPVFRESRFYHEADALAQGRQNEIVITSTTQLFDFNQDFYFTPHPGSFPNATGQCKRGLGPNGGSAILKLGFRIKIDHPTKGVSETPILGSIVMIGSNDGNADARAISYRNI
jgi:hypothetical protein